MITRPFGGRYFARLFVFAWFFIGGISPTEIGTELNISTKTVSTYRMRILEKMSLKSNADLTYYAIKNGLIE